MTHEHCKFHEDRTDVFYTYPLPSKVARFNEGWLLCKECREKVANGDLDSFVQGDQRSSTKRR